MFPLRLRSGHRNDEEGKDPTPPWEGVSEVQQDEDPEIPDLLEELDQRNDESFRPATSGYEGRKEIKIIDFLVDP